MSIVYRPPNTDQEFEDYFKFRWQQLRKPLGLERGSEQDELENSAFQMAAFTNENLIAVGRLQIDSDNTSRIRYMAVDEKFRKQGIGSAMLKELEAIAHKKNIQACWLHARDEAVTFYLKNSYKIIGAAKSELNIPHKRMEKELIT